MSKIGLMIALCMVLLVSVTCQDVHYDDDDDQVDYVAYEQLESPFDDDDDDEFHGDIEAPGVYQDYVIRNQANQTATDGQNTTTNGPNLGSKHKGFIAMLVVSWALAVIGIIIGCVLSRRKLSEKVVVVEEVVPETASSATA